MMNTLQECALDAPRESMNDGLRWNSFYLNPGYDMDMR